MNTHTASTIPHITPANAEPHPSSTTMHAYQLLYLVSPSPVPPSLEHPFPQHGHNLWVVLVGERVLGYLGHESSVRAPRLVVGGLAHLGLHVRVVHDHVGPAAAKG